jgi:phage shock protein PspC (stress-responsive transcriptional regulator)
MTSALPPSAPPPTVDQPPGSWPPPPPPGPAPRPQLRRSRSDKVIGGVAGGLAEYTGVDALLWRVGAIALTLAGGSGIIIYVLLWLLMPAAPPAQPGDGATAVDRVRTGPRSAVPGVTAAALLIVLGLAVLLSQFTDLHIGARGFLGSALLVVGVGLVIGAITGVGRGAKGGLIALGVLLSAALVVVSAVHLPHGPVGDRTFRPSTAAAVEPTYEHAAGDLTVDLRDVDVSDRDAPIVTRIEHGIGDVEVLVPSSADARVTVDNGVGDTEVFGDGADSGFYPGTGTAAWTDDGVPEFRISIHSGAGDVTVSRG